MRVVTARADAPKVALLIGCGLALAERWCYDPGGPVLFADRRDAGVELVRLEAEAAARGAVLGIVPAAPGDPLEPALDDRGWTVASQWYTGRPEPPGAGGLGI